MQVENIITLLTDFGDIDGFVGVIKGVILNINPHAHIIDITHQVPSHNISAGAFILNNSYTYFPTGTIHVAIVDPGVGGNRKAIAVKTANYFFIAPDNAILKYIFHNEKEVEVFEISNRKYFLPHVSNTFHGRDIFAPCAAHLSVGVDLHEFGTQIFDYLTGKILLPLSFPWGIEGHVIYCDTFGNLITNIPAVMVENKSFILSIGTAQISNLNQSYEEGKLQPIAVIGSSGYLEIAIFQHNAKRILNVHEGDKVRLQINHEAT